MDDRGIEPRTDELLPFDGGGAEKVIDAFASPASADDQLAADLRREDAESFCQVLEGSAPPASARSTPRSKLAAEMGETYAESLSKKGVQKCKLE